MRKGKLWTASPQKKICRCHKLLFEFIVVMNNEVLDEKKM